MKRLCAAVAILTLAGFAATGSVCSSRAATATKSKAVAKKTSAKKVPQPSQATISWGKTQCDAADKALQNGDYTKARDIFTQVLWKLPSSPRAKEGLKKAEAAIVAKQNSEKQASLNAEKAGKAEAQERLDIDKKLTGVSDAIQWEENYSQGLAVASQVGKPIMIDVNADWCPWCKVLDKKTWSNPKVMNLSMNFVCIRVQDKDKPSIQAIGNISTYPTIVFMSPAGQEIKRFEGFKEPDDMLKAMDEVLRGPAPAQGAVPMVAH